MFQEWMSTFSHFPPCTLDNDDKTFQTRLNDFLSFFSAELSFQRKVFRVKIFHSFHSSFAVKFSFLSSNLSDMVWKILTLTKISVFPLPWIQSKFKLYALHCADNFLKVLKNLIFDLKAFLKISKINKAQIFKSFFLKFKY